MSSAPSRAPSRTLSAPPQLPSDQPSKAPSQSPSQSPSSTAGLSRAPSRAPSAIPASSIGSNRPQPGGGLLSTVPEHDGNDDDDDDNYGDRCALLSAVIPASTEGSATTTGLVSVPASLAAAAAAVATSPPPLRSVYNDPEDLRRASLQSSYAALAPGERADQDAWAVRKATEFAPCPYDFPWGRHGTYPGYVCAGGAHFMSDGILAEGIPGLYATGAAHRDLDDWSRQPSLEEKIPRGYFGPVRPVGVDRHGNFTYFKNKVDRTKSKAVDSVIADVLSWKY